MKMIWLGLTLFIFLLLFLLIIFTKLTITVNYFHHNDDDDLKVEFKVWFGLIKYKIKIPLIKIDDDSPSIVLKGDTKIGASTKNQSNKKSVQITPNKISTYLKNTQVLLKHVVNLQVIMKNFFKKVSVKKIEWHSLIGVSDAATTGIMTGALWAFKGSIIGILSHFLILKQIPDLVVTPQFQSVVIQTRFRCIFQFRIGHAILAGLKLIKFWKGGRPRFKTNTSYSDEQSNSV